MNDILPETHNSEPRKRQKLWMMGAAGAVILLGLLYGVFKALPNLDGGRDFSRFATGKMAALEVQKDPPAQPEAQFQSPNATPTNLAAFKGKVVLVNLWATWCAPCVTEMPTLADLQRKFDGKDLVIIAVSVDRDGDREAAKTQLLQLSGGALAFFHDPKMAIVYPMKARGFPTSVLYDRHGEELARLAGEADWNAPEAHDLIEAALNQK